MYHSANGEGQIELIEAFARLDLDRRARTGIPEAIYGEGKSTEQIITLLRSLGTKSGIALATRVSTECGEEAMRFLRNECSVLHNKMARTVVAQYNNRSSAFTHGAIAILAAGTADIPIAEEAKVTAEVMGCKVWAFYDVGVAGIHRLLDPLKKILENEKNGQAEEQVSAVVVVAGMEGALPSVVRGLVPVPVIGVPTSVGYGYGAKGEAALMSMLQSCAPGLTVVNIDNGFGAGATAALIANRFAMSKK